MSDIKNISQVIDHSVQEYSNAQFKVIKDLQAKVSKLEAEKESLMLMLEKNTPALVNVQDLGFGITHEQLICETQIALIKKEAIIRALTLEEVRKLEILTKIKLQFETRNPDSDAISAEAMSPEALMEIAKNVSS